MRCVIENVKRKVGFVETVSTMSLELMRKVGAMLRKALSGGILSVNNFSRVRKCRERFGFGDPIKVEYRCKKCGNTNVLYWGYQEIGVGVV